MLLNLLILLIVWCIICIYILGCFVAYAYFEIDGKKLNIIRLMVIMCPFLHWHYGPILIKEKTGLTAKEALIKNIKEQFTL